MPYSNKQWQDTKQEYKIRLSTAVIMDPCAGNLLEADNTIVKKNSAKTAEISMGKFAKLLLQPRFP